MNKFTIIAGPCVVESKEMLQEVASIVSPICNELGFDYVFKASYRKANRTSVASFTGIGDERALEYLAEIHTEFGVPTITDIHTAEEATLAAQFVDVLQIPAFLCRQTDILQAAGMTGKTVNIKKGQFLAPADMAKAAAKVSATGNNSIWLTERGTTFGYHDLVVDYRGLVIMRESGYPVIYDATHSVQMPGGGEQSGGQPRFIRSLARAAVAVGIDGLFVETHPNPQKAKSDAATQLPLSEIKNFLEEIALIQSVITSSRT
ncbi:MAG: 3-deoxy-8-phosphooctulonate synthase [Bacteroidetes bacterium]|nr:3-deoxy-8-phosphooctulonate synthase [Bacteroidota bacterium]